MMVIIPLQMRGGFKVITEFDINNLRKKLIGYFY